ncbi:MAG: nucleotidyltransferase family protein [Planctomycetota bacterium]|jgi:predicted nucleotidyltransferase
MTRKAKFLQTIDSQKDVLKELGISRLGLFGSVQREEDTENSDLDVLVEF